MTNIKTYLEHVSEALRPNTVMVGTPSGSEERDPLRTVDGKVYRRGPWGGRTYDRGDFNLIKQHRVDFSNVDFSGVNMSGSWFVSCNFDGADFTGATARNTKFEGCSFVGATGVEDLGDARFEEKQPPKGRIRPKHGGSYGLLEGSGRAVWLVCWPEKPGDGGAAIFHDASAAKRAKEDLEDLHTELKARTYVEMYREENPDDWASDEDLVRDFMNNEDARDWGDPPYSIGPFDPSGPTDADQRMSDEALEACMTNKWFKEMHELVSMGADPMSAAGSLRRLIKLFGNGSELLDQFDEAPWYPGGIDGLRDDVGVMTTNLF